MDIRTPGNGAMLGIGMNYIRFAMDEPHLFRFLFQSDFFCGSTLLEMIDAEELTPVLSAMQKSLDASMEQTKAIFLTIFLFAHGYASIIANNSLKYDKRPSVRSWNRRTGVQYWQPGRGRPEGPHGKTDVSEHTSGLIEPKIFQFQ